MTAALISLCAVLWLMLSLRDRQRIKRLELDLSDATIALDTAKARLLASTHRDAALLSEAYALLHDERHKGRKLNQAEWVTARDTWTRKWRGEL